MTETTKRLKSIIGHLFKKKLKIGLFSKDTKKGTCDNEEQKSEMVNEIPAVKHREVFLILTQTVSTHMLYARNLRVDFY